MSNARMSRSLMMVTLVSCLMAAAGLRAARTAGDVTSFVATRGDVVIESDLVVPGRGTAQMPFVVLMPDVSDESAGLTNVADLAGVLAHHGIAAATLHRRTRRNGAAEDPTRPEDLALNAVAVATQLVERHVLTGRHGYVGVGLSGAMMPRVALRDEHSAFVVSVEGTTLRGRDQLAYQIARAADPALQELARATLDYLDGRTSWDGYLSIRTQFVHVPGGVLLPPARKDDRYWTLWREFSGYDPMRDWLRTATDALIVYRSGQVDNSIPVTQCLARLLDSVVLQSRVDVKVLSPADPPTEVIADWIGRRLGVAALCPIPDTASSPIGGATPRPASSGTNATR